MNEITCEMCMDLMPLVKDGIASEDSKKAVEQHIQNCEICRALYGEDAPPAMDMNHVFVKVKRKMQTFSAMLMMFGIIFGLGLTASSEMFYNSLIMPFIGALGYIIFRWSALYLIPALLFVVHFVVNFLTLIRGAEHLDFLSLITMTFIYCIFALVGFVIAKLLHFAFKKEGS